MGAIGVALGFAGIYFALSWAIDFYFARRRKRMGREFDAAVARLLASVNTVKTLREEELSLRGTKRPGDC